MRLGSTVQFYGTSFFEKDIGLYLEIRYVCYNDSELFFNLEDPLDFVSES